MTRGVYAGSFDPVHLGHLAIIERAARACDELFVIVSGNPNKPGALFDLDERRDLVEASTQHLGNVTARTHSGMTVDLAVELRAAFLVRGIGKEQATELEMAAANLRLSGLPTLFIPPEGTTSWISSRHIRSEFHSHGADAVAGLIPEAVLDRLRQGVRSRSVHTTRSEL